MDDNNENQDNKPLYEHIPRTDIREYLTPEDEDNREDDLEYRRIFGLDPISGATIGAHLPPNFLTTEEKEERHRKKNLGYARSDLIRLSQFPSRTVYLREFLGRNHDASVSAEDFSPKNLPDDTLSTLIEDHVTKTRQAIAELSKQIPGFFERFDLFVNKRGERVDLDFLKMLGVDPLSAAAFSEIFPVIKRKYKEERNRFHVAIADPMTVVPLYRGDYLGIYDPLKNTIFLYTIPRHDFVPSFSRTLAHEIFHGLSGITSVGQIKTNEYGEEYINYVDIQRLGLRFGHPEELYRDKDYQAKERLPRFHWLNEAVTEELTTLVFNGIPGSYGTERKILYDLATAMSHHTDQNPFLLFYNVYFEDYDPSQPPGKRVPHWHELQHVITATFGSGFLVDLDNYINTHGVRKGRQFLKEKISTMSEKGST